MEVHFEMSEEQLKRLIDELSELFGTDSESDTDGSNPYSTPEQQTRELECPGAPRRRAHTWLTFEEMVDGMESASEDDVPTESDGDTEEYVSDSDVEIIEYPEQLN